MVDVTSRHCKKCDGMMHTTDVKKFPNILGYIIIGIGVLVSLTILGALIGVPMVILGLKMNSTVEHLWLCEKCRYKEKAIIT